MRKRSADEWQQIRNEDSEAIQLEELTYKPALDIGLTCQACGDFLK
jgi:hypothetical protein